MKQKVHILNKQFCGLLFTFTKSTPREKRLDIRVISSVKEVADTSRRC
jgi:hypothetical protein